MPDKPSLLQQIADGAMSTLGGQKLGPAIADVLTSRLIYDDDDQHHPKGERRGSVENLIKAIGLKFGTLVTPDMPYLEQYLHPNAEVLPPTSERPPFTTPNIPFRKPHYSGGIVNDGGLGRYTRVNPTDGSTEPSPMHPDLDKPQDFSPDKTHVYDVWDFDTDFGMTKDTAGGAFRRLDPLIKELMKRAGQPYAVYGPNRER